jgi:hypothetical protein
MQTLEIPMISIAEQTVNRLVRQVLSPLRTAASIPESEDFRELLVALAFFLPEVLVELYAEWAHESLDGVIPLHARKTGEREAEIYGLCILLSDHTTTPIHLRLQAAAHGDGVAWFECRIGEAGENGMIRTKCESSAKRLHALEGRAATMEWVYRATFGHRTTEGSP